VKFSDVARGGAKDSHKLGVGVRESIGDFLSGNREAFEFNPSNFFV